jgi:hypothetical protein
MNLVTIGVLGRKWRRRVDYVFEQKFLFCAYVGVWLLIVTVAISMSYLVPLLSLYL